VDDLGERRIDRHWWNEATKPAEGVTNEQAQAWLVRSDDAGRLAKALLEARAEVERLTALVREGIVHVEVQYDADPQADTFHWLRDARQAMKGAPLAAGEETK
jgi:hypothetical protein